MSGRRIQQLVLETFHYFPSNSSTWLYKNSAMVELVETQQSRAITTLRMRFNSQLSFTHDNCSTNGTAIYTYVRTGWRTAAEVGTMMGRKGSWGRRVDRAHH